MFNRVALLGVLLAGLMVGQPILAHDNHEELGAGPGPVAAQNAAGIAPAAEKAEVVQTHAEGTIAHEEAMEHHVEATDENKTFGQRLVSWLGRLHTQLVHFPIAMFIGALAVELYGLWRKSRDYQRAAQVMLVVGAIGAVVAAFLGWFAGGFYLTDRNIVLMIHRWLGTAIAVAGVILLYLAGAAHRAPEKPRTLYWTALGALTMAIAVQGYLGGTFMHGGMDHMAF